MKNAGQATVMLVALLASVSLLHGRDITALDGKTYRNVRVTRTDATGIAITHSAGACFLSFSQLPDAIKREFGYDPVRAAEFSAEKERLEQERASIDEQKKELERQRKLLAEKKQAVAAGTQASETNSVSMVKSYAEKSFADKDYTGRTYDTKSYDSKAYSSTEHSGSGGNLSGEYTATGKAIYVGPRGGRYHYSATGKKVYEKRGRR